MDALDIKLNDSYGGKVVRKDLTKAIKEGANVPSYVLEYLLGIYCATDNEDDIKVGVESVKHVLADNFVRPDEAEKIKAKIKYKMIVPIPLKNSIVLFESFSLFIASITSLVFSFIL